VVCVQELLPGVIAECGGVLGGRDDIGKEHGCEHAVEVGGFSDLGQKPSTCGIVASRSMPHGT
jgi:hypothetical protein